MVLQLLLTLPVGSCSCEAVELSFSCLRRLKIWSKGLRRVCGKGTTFTIPVLWTNKTLSICLICFATLATMTAVCENFNLLHFWSTAQSGAWPKLPNGKYANGWTEGASRTDGERGAWVYNGGLGAEQSPQRGPGAETLVRGSEGESPLKLKASCPWTIQTRVKNCHFSLVLGLK